MRLLLLALLFFGLSGCATQAALSYHEQCALDGLVLSGVTSESSSAIVTGSRGGFAAARGHSNAVSCEVPKTQFQACQARRLSQVAYPKTKYNDTTGLWNAGIGVGYLLWIAPGIGMKLLADKKFDQAFEESHKIDRETQLACTPEQPATENRTPASP